MQASLGCLRSLLVSRSFASSKESVRESKLVTAVSGFPKQKTGYNVDSIMKGQIGEDAYFVATHFDEWDTKMNGNEANGCSMERDELYQATIINTSSRHSDHIETSVLKLRSRDSSRSGRRWPPPSPSLDVNNNEEFSINHSDDNNDHSKVGYHNNSADVIGVADGVGGWRQHGIDPGRFSSRLMRTCESFVKKGQFRRDAPARLLASSLQRMSLDPQQVIGSSTACVMMLSHSDLKLYTANLGDSGFVVVRGDRVVHRSQEQTHFFNTPFQMALPPSHLASQVLVDQPESADQYVFNVQDGDVIMLATDGIFDNLPECLLLNEISSKVVNVRDDELTTASATLATRLQTCANSLALMARKLSQDPSYLSPFAKQARKHGFSVSGGKEDDITVLLAAVRESPS